MLPTQTTKRYGSAPSVQVFPMGSTSKRERKKVAGCCSIPMLVVYTIFTVFVLGMYVCFKYILEMDPRHTMQQSLSITSVSGKHKLPTVNVKRKMLKPEFTELPDWSLEQWTPISVTNIHIKADGSVDASLTLCQLDFSTYAKTPHKYPMFRDLVSMSKCNQGIHICFQSLTTL